MITIIVAYNKNRVIGDSSGKIPWHIPEDLKLFKKLTLGHPCIMGKNTWNGIPEKYRPLSGRVNIVVTRSPDKFNHPGVYACSSVEQAIELAYTFDQEIFITGGSQIYKYCLDNNLVDRILASEIHGHLDVDGTAFFPELDGKWAGKVLQKNELFDLVEKFIKDKKMKITVVNGTNKFGIRFQNGEDLAEGGSEIYFESDQIKEIAFQLKECVVELEKIMKH